MKGYQARETRRFSNRSSVLLAAVMVAMVPARVQADVHMPLIFSDHMVLQRDTPISVWGRADPGEAVSVTLGARKAGTAADAIGRWRVRLDPLPANASGETLVVAGRNTVRFRDVVVGDVWLCAGQSNMAKYLGECDNASEVLPRAGDPLLRIYRVVERFSFTPREDLPPLWNGRAWRPSAPDEVNHFSAVAHFFGRELRRTQNVPVGLISVCYGGTRAQLYMREDAIARNVDADPEFRRWIQQRKQAVLAQAAAGTPTAMPKDAQFSTFLTGIIFNGMIAPLTLFPIKGVIWYQAESNCDEARQYGVLFPLLIKDWRAAWGLGDFPFLFVQLPNIGLPATEPVQDRDRWTRIREAQAKALTLPNTGMAVTIDVGDVDVHPTSKIDVGTRLALLARKQAYGETIVASGPTFRALNVEGGTAWLSFDHVGSGLTIGTPPPAPSRKAVPLAGELAGFAMSGQDRVWFQARARIVGDRLALTSDRVKHPVAVRYGWADDPPCNLYNLEKLPAAPFRTDDWEL